MKSESFIHQPVTSQLSFDGLIPNNTIVEQSLKLNLPGNENNYSPYDLIEVKPYRGPPY